MGNSVTSDLYLNTKLPDVGENVYLSRVSYVNDISYKLTDEVRFNFEGIFKGIVRKQFYALMMCIKKNNFECPPNDIRKYMFHLILKSEQEYDDDIHKKQFEDSKLVLDSYNTKIKFLEFLMCVKKTGYVFPQNVLKKIYDIYYHKHETFKWCNAAPSA